VVKSIINQNHFGMMNIGFNPTVWERNDSPFFDFDTDLYDQKFQYLNTSVRSKNSILLIYQTIRKDKSTAITYLQEL
jgi:FAD synthase